MVGLPMAEVPPVVLLVVAVAVGGRPAVVGLVAAEAAVPMSPVKRSQPCPPPEPLAE